MNQAIQIAGAFAILVASVLGQRGTLNPRAYAYLWLNLVGAAVLAVDAYLERQWGFLLLEAVWTIVTAWTIGETFAASRDARGPRSAGCRA